MKFPYPKRLVSRADYLKLVSTKDDPGVFNSNRVQLFITAPAYASWSTVEQKWYLSLILEIDAGGTPIGRYEAKPFKGERSHGVPKAAGGSWDKRNL